MTIETHAVHHQIAAHFGQPANEVSFNATLEDLGADWLDVIELELALEDEFSVTIADDAVRQTSTVSEVIGAVRDAAAAAERVAL